MGGNNLDYSKPIKYYLKDFLSRQALSSRFLPKGLNYDADWKGIVQPTFKNRVLAWYLTETALEDVDVIFILFRTLYWWQ